MNELDIRQSDVMKTLNEFDQQRLKLIANAVSNYEMFKVGEKTTVVLLKAENGFEIIGTSACINPADFDEKLGFKYAMQDALDQLEALEGYKSHGE